MKILFLMLLAYSLFAEIYDSDYKILKSDDTPKEELNKFFYDDFKKIVRFDMISFDGDEMQNSMIDDTNLTQYDIIIKSIKNHITRDEDIYINVIGHTSSNKDLNKSLTLGMKYAKKIESAFIIDKIPKEIISLESRGDKDMLYSNETNYGDKLSNRVMVTIYINSKKDKKNDN